MAADGHLKTVIFTFELRRKETTMTSILDNEKIDFQCPNCNRKIVMTVRQLKRPGNTCPGCGASFDTAEFKRELNKVDRELKKLEKEIGNINIQL